MLESLHVAASLCTVQIQGNATDVDSKVNDGC
jgi:hypothetical protein